MLSLALAALVPATTAWTATQHAATCPRSSLLRPRVALLAVQSAAPEAQDQEQKPSKLEGKAVPTRSGRPTGSLNQKINTQLTQADDSEGVLALVEEHANSLNAVNMATALHVIAVRNKRKRARRDALLRDSRFQLLVDKLQAHPRPQDFAPRSVSDVLWSFATLQHWPSTLLTPVLTSVSVQLEREAFEAHHLSTIVWALAKLQCKPVRLLERIEAQAADARYMSALDMQNVANLLWGFAMLRYQPSTLLPPLSAALAQSGMFVAAKPVEVADVAFALARLAQPGEHGPLLLAMAECAAPGAALDDFSSRQLVTLVACFARLDAADGLPDGRMDAWVDAVRAAHGGTPLLAVDAEELERALARLGRDGSWIKSTEMLITWTDLADGIVPRSGRKYSDDELRAVFEAIDTDKSGEIDQAELKAAIKQINPEADDATITKMLSFADADGSASIDFPEFKIIYSGMIIRPRSSSPEAPAAKEE